MSYSTTCSEPLVGSKDPLDRKLANSLMDSSEQYRRARAERDAPKSSKLSVPETWRALLRSFNGECDATMATRRGSEPFEFVDDKIPCAREHVADHFWRRAVKLARPVDVKLVALDVDGAELGSVATRIA